MSWLNCISTRIILHPTQRLRRVYLSGTQLNTEQYYQWQHLTTFLEYLEESTSTFHRVSIITQHRARQICVFG